MRASEAYFDVRSIPQEEEEWACAVVSCKAVNFSPGSEKLADASHFNPTNWFITTASRVISGYAQRLFNQDERRSRIIYGDDSNRRSLGSGAT